MKQLHLAHGLTLPADLCTHVTLIVGKRGSGKTNSAKRLVEQAIHASVPVAVLDPADVWYGLKAGADGRADGGLSVYIFGGRHQDLPLEPTAGALLADVVVDQRISTVMALREFSNAERARFVTDFAERLIRRNTQPLLLVLEEAHEVMPQSPMREEARSLGAILRVVRLGRSSGIGLVEVTQRLAQLHKTATTSADVLLAHRTIGPQDRDALEEWIKYHHAGSFRAQFMEELPGLKTGEAWIWAPDFPEDHPIGLRRIAVDRCETFDSHATPTVGAPVTEPKALAAVDLERLRTQLAATIERAKAEDPRALRQALAENSRALDVAERALAARTMAPSATPALTEADRRLLLKLSQQFDALFSEAWHGNRSLRALGAIQKAFEDFKTAWMADHGQMLKAFEQRLEAKGLQKILAKSATPQQSALVRRLPPVARVAPPARAPHQSDEASMSPARQKILNGLAFLASRGLPAADKTQLALIVGVSPTSGGYFNNLGALRSAGLIAYPSGGTVALTRDGQALASVDGIPTTTAELHDAIRQKLPPAKWKIIEALVQVYPGALTKDDLAEQIGVSPTSGGYFNNLGSLRSLGLIRYPRPSEVAAQPVLFLP